MRSQPAPHIASVIGRIPYRIALAGGWIDQPFVSRHNPAPPGSMVVVGIEPTFRCMDRSGMATSTREVARKLWGDKLPNQDPRELVRMLYNAENAGKPEPSGSQDMAGLIFPGITRLDYDATHEGGYFPAHIETSNNTGVARWLENVLHLLPISPGPTTTVRSKKKISMANGSGGWANREKIALPRFWRRT